MLLEGRSSGGNGGLAIPERIILLAPNLARPRPAAPQSAATPTAGGMSGFWVRQVYVSASGFINNGDRPVLWLLTSPLSLDAHLKRIPFPCCLSFPGCASCSEHFAVSVSCPCCSLLLLLQSLCPIQYRTNMNSFLRLFVLLAPYSCFLVASLLFNKHILHCLTNPEFLAFCPTLFLVICLLRVFSR